ATRMRSMQFEAAQPGAWNAGVPWTKGRSLIPCLAASVTSGSTPVQSKVPPLAAWIAGQYTRKRSDPTFARPMRTKSGCSSGVFATPAVAWGAIVVWAAIMVGIWLRAWPGADVPAHGIAAVACLAALAGLSLVSLAWADDGGRALAASLLPAAYAGLLAFVLL